ncbi:MAG: PASTA domain-containing protein, partial [Erysipelotrichaceae bacterium]
MNFFKSKLNVILLIILLALLGIGGFFGYKMFIKPDVAAINFSDMSSDEITAWFNDNKLSDKLVIEEDYDDTVAEGRVIYQSVKEGDPIKNKVTVIISKGKDPNSNFTIPVENQTYDSIKLWFSEHGFSNVSYTYTDSAETESGRVLSVNPSSARPEEAVTVEIAGKELLSVPEFSAYTKTEIDTWAKDHDITVKYLYESSSSVKEGGVIKQSISAGQSITEGGTITITLSQGDVKTATIPATMLGTSEDDFLKALKDLGFTNIKKDTTTYFSVKSAKGTVFSYDDGNLPLTETINYALSAGQYTFDKTEYEGKSLTKVQEMVKEYNARNAHITLETTEEKSNDVNAGDLYSCTSEFKSPNITVSCKLSKGDGTTTKATLPTNLLGSSEADFLAKCKSLGFTNVVKDESGYYSTLNAKGTVAYYDPDGEMLTSTKITYRLSLGAYSFNAADFNGKSLSDGEALIKKYNELNAHITSSIKTSGSGTYLSNCSGIKDGINTTISCTLTGSSTGSDTPSGTKATLPTNLLGYSETNFLDKCKSLGFTNVVKDESGYYST